MAAEKCTAVEILRRVSAELHVFPLRTVMYGLYGGALIIRAIKLIKINHVLMIFQDNIFAACLFLVIIQSCTSYLAYDGRVHLERQKISR